ncbi:MAG: hypothetical protein ACKN97_04915, partial [Acidobacteriota bacterium]
MSNKSLGKFLFYVMAILAIAYSVSAQSDQPQDPNSKSRNFKEEVKRVYQDWVKKDVAYIIMLKTPAGRLHRRRHDNCNGQSPSLEA